MIKDWSAITQKPNIRIDHTLIIGHVNMHLYIWTAQKQPQLTRLSLFSYKWSENFHNTTKRHFAVHLCAWLMRFWYQRTQKRLSKPFSHLNKWKFLTFFFFFESVNLMCKSLPSWGCESPPLFSRLSFPTPHITRNLQHAALVRAGWVTSAC